MSEVLLEMLAISIGIFFLSLICHVCAVLFGDENIDDEGGE